MRAQRLKTKKNKNITTKPIPKKSESTSLAVVTPIVNAIGMALISKTIASLQYLEIFFFFIAEAYYITFQFSKDTYFPCSNLSKSIGRVNEYV